ncbi:MAG: bifunctional diaminohydroxyphosphoribosylaminopyrimidine deaminase/5-amino-6-(5-phosphoribosylamino)uracil reductase RibD [Spirulinaceae cyanobacterium]
MMHKCLELALCALGKTSPNPLVGAVVVKDGKVVGTGFHPGAGQPHAEVFALREAGEQSQGATVYVNLEPCNHYGRTPPCSQALIKAGVAKVVVGIIDPDPRVSGEGIKTLRNAGIEVIIGVEEEACRQINEAFIHRILHQRPFGILKYAMTLDGKIATNTGHSSWVTSKAARQRVHQLRGACDAVIVGGNTVRRDNPHLTTHGLSEHNPVRVVMSRRLNLPKSAHLWNQAEAATLVFTEEGAVLETEELLETQGVEVVKFATLTPGLVMENLYRRGMCSVIWECGGVLAAKAIADGAVQKVMAFIAPKIIGGKDAPSPVASLGFTEMGEALLLKKISLTQIEPDFLLEGYLY